MCSSAGIPRLQEGKDVNGSKPLLGGVELGGTKCVCLIGTGPDDIRFQISVPVGHEQNADVVGAMSTAGIPGRLGM